MATKTAHATDILLRGSSGSHNGAAEHKGGQLHFMRIELAQNVVNELLSFVKSGKQPQIHFGRSPQIRCGDSVHVLNTANESFRHEIYKHDDGGTRTFKGAINHKLSVHKVEESTAGSDAALQQLKSNIATINQEKEARKTVVDSGINQPPRGKQAKSFKARPLLDSSPMTDRSLPSSPYLNPTSRPRPPTSAPDTMSMEKAHRIPMIHILACGPKTKDELTKKFNGLPQVISEILPKVAVQGGSQQWTLQNKNFKELDVFGFKYKSSAERGTAIDNAIRAYDRLRLPRDDPLWQKLLPKEERGKGKCLSRLKLNAPAPGGATTPALSQLPKKSDRKKDASAKKADAKKKGPEGADEKATQKPVDEGPKKKDDVAVKAVKAAKATKAGASVKEPVRQAEKVTKANATKVPASASNGTASKSSKDPAKAPAKAMLSKPKNPSPLSASPPVNASDFEDDHPVHKALSASVSPSKPLPAAAGNSDRALKRKANDLDNNIHSHPVVPRKAAKISHPPATPHNASKPGSAASTSSSSSLKRKAESVEDLNSSTTTPTPAAKVRKLDPVNTVVSRPAARVNGANGVAKHESDDESLSPSPTSPPAPVTLNEIMRTAETFNSCYAKYAKLHRQLSEASQPPTDVQRRKLLEMHKSLKEMKAMIEKGGLRNSGEQQAVF